MGETPRFTMIPLSNVSDSTFAAVQGIAFDVDETITREGIFQPEALQALYDANHAGLNLVALTGRPLGWADVLAQLLPIQLAVGENGAGWAFRSSAGLQRGYIHSDEERAAQRRRLDACVTLVQNRFPHIRLSADQIARRCDVAFSIGEVKPLPRGDIDGLISLIATQGFRTTESSIHVHALAGDWDKAKGLLAAWEAYRSTPLVPEEWVFVGDSGNDEAAFAYFPLSTGVANVRQHAERLTRLPKFVTHASHGRGFAELVGRVLGAR